MSKQKKNYRPNVFVDHVFEVQNSIRAWINSHSGFFDPDSCTSTVLSIWLQIIKWIMKIYHRKLTEEESRPQLLRAVTRLLDHVIVKRSHIYYRNKIKICFHASLCISVHSSVFPFQCCYCAKTTVHIVMLLRHLVGYTWCDYDLQQSNYLRDHKGSHLTLGNTPSYVTVPNFVALVQTVPA